MGLIDEALDRQEHAGDRIDYDRMRELRPRQKAALTRAVKSGDPERVAQACKQAVREWSEVGAWPDDWSRWQRALDDALCKAGRFVHIDISTL